MKDVSLPQQRGQRDGAGDGNRGPNPDVSASVHWAPRADNLTTIFRPGPGACSCCCVSSEWALCCCKGPLMECRVLTCKAWRSQSGLLPLIAKRSRMRGTTQAEMWCSVAGKIKVCPPTYIGTADTNGVNRCVDPQIHRILSYVYACVRVCKCTHAYTNMHTHANK